jgi:arylsulfatase A-like enzyme
VQTGRYHQLMGLNNALAWDSTKGLPPAEITVAEHLRDHGYNTALVGKWHLGRQNEFWPNNHGYNYFFGMTAGAADYFSHEDAGGQIDWWENFTHLKTREYSTSAFTREAIKFLNRTTQPFLLVLAYQAVHAPYQAPDGTTDYRKTLVAMDESIGQVTAALPSSTYVFFLSDNGGAKPSNNAPLRGNKGSVYEGGHRVTALASGPGVPGGAHRDALLAAIDLFPTILALTGIPAPLGVQLDGRDFSPVLLGTGTLPARQLFFTQGSDWAVRDNKKWKLLYDGSSNKLFDMTTDIGEEYNIAGSHPDIVSALTVDFNAWAAHFTADSGIIDFAGLNGVPLCFPDEDFGEGLPG